MTKKKVVPSLRFKGFDDEWVENKLGDFGYVGMNKRIFKEQTTTSGEIPFYKIGTFGDICDAYISKELFQEYKRKYPYPKVGDILISASGSIGKTVQFSGENAYFQDSNIVWLAHDSTLNNMFLKSFYCIVKWYGLEGSTIKRLYNSSILNTNIPVPNFNEQTQIGEFFKNIDQLISVNQKKYNKLIHIKKALLEKMFPQQGETVPKLRFDGFSGEWEEKEIGNVTTVNNGCDYKHLHSGEIPVYGTGGYMLSVDKALSYKEDAIGIGRKGTINKPYILHAPFWTVDTLFYCIPIGNNNLKFIYCLFQIIDWKSKDQSTGVPSLSKEIITSSSIIITQNKTEQTQIGELFKQIDSLIHLQQQKLNKLKNIKQACLEKMFV